MFELNDYWEEEFQSYCVKNLEGIYFDNCIFTKCDFSRSFIENCKFTECTFINCNLSLSTFKSSTLNDVIFKSSKLIGISWSNCNEPFNVLFDSSNISQNSFHTLDLRQMKFINSTIIDAGFEKCNLENAVFNNCDLKQTVFVNNSLKKANFKTSKNYLINPKQNNIEKAQFSLPEALSFLSLLPIEIE